MQRTLFCTADAWGSNPMEGYHIKNDERKVTADDNQTKEIVKEAVEDAASILPFAAECYNISADIKDYILVPVVSMPSDLPNRNGQAFSYEELTRFLPDVGRIAYKSWEGMPCHADHCFPANAPIVTKNGRKKIQNVKIGDKVLTHKNNYKKVVKLYDNGQKWLSEVKCMGMAENIFATENHPFWVIDRRQFCDKFQNHAMTSKEFNRYTKWEDVNPHFRPLSDAYVGDYLCMPIHVGGKINVSPELAFLTGAFMAEGCYEWYKKVPTALHLTIGRNETEFREKIISCAESLGFKTNVVWHKKINICNIRIACGRDFARRMLDMTGNLAHKKSMRGELRNWNQESIKWFLGGYITGDGCIKKFRCAKDENSGRVARPRLRCRTVSKKLAIDVQQAFAFVGVVSTINKDGKPKDYNYFCNIYNKMRHMKGRASYTIASSDYDFYVLNDYHLKMKVETPSSKFKSQNYVMLLDNYIVTPIMSIKHKTKFEKVYNIEVEDDNSYVAYGVAVHNRNSDYTKAKGIILGCHLKPLKSTEGDLWKVIKLCAFDRNRDPVLANEILSRKRTAYSMGALAENYRCSICSALLSNGGCSHVERNKPVFNSFNNKIAYYNVVNFKGLELSSVETPAYHSAFAPNYFML